jgi:SAM-dependent methyltransferase
VRFMSRFLRDPFSQTVSIEALRLLSPQLVPSTLSLVRAPRRRLGDPASFPNFVSALTVHHLSARTPHRVGMASSSCCVLAVSLPGDSYPRSPGPSRLSTCGNSFDLHGVGDAGDGPSVTAGERSSLPEYDVIGVGYGSKRRPDRRLVSAIDAAIGAASTILNVGAGAGSYEPSDRPVVSLEPSGVMLAQHPGRRRVRGAAEHLPFDDGSFDVAMAILTVHHWKDLEAGLAELRRVARRQVLFTWDPDHERKLWITTDYVPAIDALETGRFTSLLPIVEALGVHTVEPFEIPHDFTDGFQAAFWRRPEMYLDPEVRTASSTFASLPPELVEPGIERLRRDLRTGRWHAAYGELLALDRLDLGHRILIAG